MDPNREVLKVKDPSGYWCWAWWDALALVLVRAGQEW